MEVLLEAPVGGVGELLQTGVGVGRVLRQVFQDLQAVDHRVQPLGGGGKEGKRIKGEE